MVLAVETYCLRFGESGGSAPISRWAPRARRLRHVHGVFTENDGARRATGLAHARAQLGQLLVGVDHVALDGLTGRLVVATVVDRYPEALVTLRLTEVGPAHSASHSGDNLREATRHGPQNSPLRTTLEAKRFWQASSITGGRQVAMSGLRSSVKNREPDPSRERPEAGFPTSAEPGFFSVSLDGYSQLVPFSPRAAPLAPIDSAAEAMALAWAQLPLRAANLTALGALDATSERH